jgi:hypothetical protein
VAVASPNTAAYFSRSATTPTRGSAANSFATSVAMRYLAGTLEISESPVG